MCLLNNMLCTTEDGLVYTHDASIKHYGSEKGRRKLNYAGKRPGDVAMWRMEELNKAKGEVASELTAKRGYGVEAYNAAKRALT